MPLVNRRRLLIAKTPAFQRALHAWYRQHHRRLPWRETPSLYPTVVSEFMLQQTQIKTALPYFERWMRALPDFASLAAASEAQVLKLWEGLGYYSRARNLHRLARTLVALPAPPCTPDGWRELPGVGPYTAAAITSLSFGAPAACVDGNVVRVLARLTGNRQVFPDGATAAMYFTPLANLLLKRSEPGLHNQAMMELGALVCSRHQPQCAICPVREFCVAVRRGDPEKYPQLARKKAEQRAVARVWCEHRGRLLLHRAAVGARRLANLHELPSSDQLGLANDAVRAAPLLARKRRGFTNHQITESIHAFPFAMLPPLTPATRAILHWVPMANLDHITFSGPHRRWVDEILRIRKHPGIHVNH